MPNVFGLLEELDLLDPFEILEHPTDFIAVTGEFQWEIQNEQIGVEGVVGLHDLTVQILQEVIVLLQIPSNQIPVLFHQPDGKLSFALLVVHCREVFDRRFGSGAVLDGKFEELNGFREVPMENGKGCREK